MLCTSEKLEHTITCNNLFNQYLNKFKYYMYVINAALTLIIGIISIVAGAKKSIQLVRANLTIKFLFILWISVSFVLYLLASDFQSDFNTCMATRGTDQAAADYCNRDILQEYGTGLFISFFGVILVSITLCTTHSFFIEEKYMILINNTIEDQEMEAVELKNNNIQKFSELSQSD